MSVNTVVAAGTGLATIMNQLNRVKAGTQTSLIRQSHAARVEPIVVIDPELVYYEGTSEIMQSCLSQITAFYLQVVAMTTSIGGVTVAKRLEAINPSRKPTDNFQIAIGIEGAYEDGLPTMSRICAATEARVDNVSVSAKAGGLSASARVGKDGISGGIEADQAAGEFVSMFTGKDAMAATQELANLSIGKLFNVSVNHEGKDFHLPVSIRLIAKSVRPDVFMSFFVKQHLDKTMADRFYAWKVGRLEFIKDILLARDAIRRHKQDLMKDTDGVLDEIARRDTNNRLSGVLSNSQSLNGLANVLVMSSNTARQVEAKLGGRFKDLKFRQARMEELSAMMLVIVDKEYDRVTFYYDTIPLGSELGLRDLKSSNKGSGPSIMEILKAFQYAAAPSL